MPMLPAFFNPSSGFAMPSEVAESTGEVEITIEGLNIGDGE